MNILHLKDALQKEQERLMEGMSMIGVMNSEIDGDWVVHTEKSDETEPDMIADKVDEIETNEGILSTLEERMKEVNDALERIEKGSYGNCIKCNKQIEEKRLEANPAALTCLACTQLEDIE